MSGSSSTTRTRVAIDLNSKWNASYNVVNMRLAIVCVALVSSFGQDLSTLLSSTPPNARHLTVATASSTTAVEPGARVSLFVDVSPKPGIHVYAPGATGYLPIALTLNAPPSVKAWN